MSNEKQNKLIIFPNYIEGCSDHAKHKWLEWNTLAGKIENHPERFYDVVHPKTGALKTFDCRACVGLVVKWAKGFGASDVDVAEIKRRADMLQQLKGKKAHANKEWGKEVYGGKRGEKSILDIRSAEIMDLYSKFYSTEEIVKFITDKWNISIRYDSVRAFFIENKDRIDQRRADYLLTGKELRLATDAGRLELLSKLAWEMELKFDKNKSTEASKELRAIIEQIRKEVKGEEIRLTVDGKIDINASIQANMTIHEALQKLPINMIVIGLTAAKQGINPASIIGSLANSFYSQFNGFNKLAGQHEVALPGQYIKSYNWDELRVKNDNCQVYDEAIEVYENIEEEPVKIAAKVGREDMMKMLAQIKTGMK